MRNEHMQVSELSRSREHPRNTKEHDRLRSPLECLMRWRCLFDRVQKASVAMGRKFAIASHSASRFTTPLKPATLV